MPFTDQCFTSNTASDCTSDWVSCCPGGDGSGANCVEKDCSNPGVTPCEGGWMSQNCEAICRPCEGSSDTISIKNIGIIFELDWVLGY